MDPQKDKSLELGDDLYKEAVRERLCLDNYTSSLLTGVRLECTVCNREVATEDTRHHVQGCIGGQGERVLRHNQVRNILQKMFRTMGMDGVEVEKTIQCEKTNDSRRADVFFYTKEGKQMWIDNAVGSASVQMALDEGSDERALVRARLFHEAKMAYWGLGFEERQLETHFQPLVFEATGRCGVETDLFFTQLIAQSDDPKQTAEKIKWCKYRIATAIIRSNAKQAIAARRKNVTFRTAIDRDSLHVAPERE